MSDAKKSGDRLPPHSEEMERGLLGCVMLAPEDTLAFVAERRIGEEHFYDLRHQILFRHMVALGALLNELTLTQRLMEAQLYEQIGGLAFISGVVDSVPSASGVEYFAEQVMEKFLMRRVIATCTDVVSRVYAHDGDADSLVDEVEADIVKLSESRAPIAVTSVHQVMVDQVIPEMDEHYSRGRTNLPPGNLSTGFDYFDKLSGGFGCEEYICIAGRPGGGKTAVAMNIADFHAMQGTPVAVFSLEMSKKALTRRLLFKRARVSMGKFRQGFCSKADHEALVTAAGTFRNCPLYIDDEPSQSIGQIEAKARTLIRKYGIKLFVLDYIQLVLPNARRGRIDRVTELTDISARIVAMKKRFKVPWLVLAQMNRNIETTEVSRVPVLSDIKDCGGIEQDSDQIIFCYYPPRGKRRQDKGGNEVRDLRAQEEDWLEEKHGDKEHSERPVRVDLFQAKHRDGPTGPVEFLFHKNQSRIEDWRQYAIANGFRDYGKGERAAANPAERDEWLPEGDEP